PGMFGDQPLEHERVMELLRAEGSSLASFSDEHIMRIGEVTNNNWNLVVDHTPEVFDGDLLLVVAAAEEETAEAEVATRVSQLRPYVTGRISTTEIRCWHRQLLQPGPGAEIGRAVRDRLRDLGD
ncbi:MAG TPA: hypothetical protein VGD43_04925, partial [Micromonospora sp.]